MRRTDILNALISKFNYESYLEVGTQSTAQNFDLINAKHKVCIDPFPNSPVTFTGTSDEYFEQLADTCKYDIIFIDGLHHAEQVLKDVENSLKHLSDNGTIVCHDCLPSTEHMQLRDDGGGEWTGDVWKAIVELRMTRSDLSICVVNADYGCAIIRKGTSDRYIPTSSLYNTYEYYSIHKNSMLNVISIDTFIEEYIRLKFSIIIPTMWQSEYLLEMLKRYSESKYVTEIILIDNAPELNKNITLPKLIHIKETENTFVNPAWNKGVGLCKSEYITIANDDILYDVDEYYNYLSQLLTIYNFKKVGFVGSHSTNYELAQSSHPRFEVYDNTANRGGWGCLFSFEKSNWLDIPSDLKIWYGDNWIHLTHPTILQLVGMKITTKMSTTSDSPQWDSYKTIDKLNFSKFLEMNNSLFSIDPLGINSRGLYDWNSNPRLYTKQLLVSTATQFAEQITVSNDGVIS